MPEESVAKQRTAKQSRALHLYFQMVADALNDAGYDMKKTLKPSIEIPWNGGTVKEFLWRSIQKTVTGKFSTKQLTTKEIDEVWEVLNRHLSEKFGISEPFPSVDEIIRRQEEFESKAK